LATIHATPSSEIKCTGKTSYDNDDEDGDDDSDDMIEDDNESMTTMMTQ
jgi:hypothetical protein